VLSCLLWRCTKSSQVFLFWLAHWCLQILDYCYCAVRTGTRERRFRIPLLWLIPTVPVPVRTSTLLYATGVFDESASSVSLLVLYCTVLGTAVHTKPLFWEGAIAVSDAQNGTVVPWYWYCKSTSRGRKFEFAGFKYGDSLLHVLCNCTYCTGTNRYRTCNGFSLEREDPEIWNFPFLFPGVSPRAHPSYKRNIIIMTLSFCDTRPRKSPSKRFGVEGMGICTSIGRLSDVITCAIRYLHV
jgi:hypothetical protein